jgi:hypothetical protein
MNSQFKKKKKKKKKTIKKNGGIIHYGDRVIYGNTLQYIIVQGI